MGCERSYRHLLEVLKRSAGAALDRLHQGGGLSGTFIDRVRHGAPFMTLRLRELPLGICRSPGSRGGTGPTRQVRLRQRQGICPGRLDKLAFGPICPAT